MEPLGETERLGELLARRPLTSRYHLEAVVRDGNVTIDVVKTTNGQIVSPDEPLFLVRARDLLAVPLLLCYRALIKRARYPDEAAKREHLETNDDAIQLFEEFAVANPERMKLPNITRGK